MTALLAVVFVAASALASVSAQTLADAARKAEEQRKENAGKSLVVPQPIEDDGDLHLSESLIWRYGQARALMADLRKRDKKMDERLFGAVVGTIHEYSDVIAVLESEPALADALAVYRLTPALYAAIDETIGKVCDVHNAPKGMYRELTPGETENVSFGLANWPLIQWAVEYGAKHEFSLVPLTSRVPHW